MGKLASQLRDRGACPESVAWAGDRDLATAWAECVRGGWMLWLLNMAAEWDDSSGDALALADAAHGAYASAAIARESAMAIRKLVPTPPGFVARYLEGK